MEQKKSWSLISIIIILFVGGLIGYLISVSMIDEPAPTAAQPAPETENNSQEVNSTFVEGEGSETAFNIAVDNLEPTQVAAARAAGVEGENIVVTKSMVACAEFEVGAERLGQIQGGSSLSLEESLAFINCYRDNN